MINAIVNGQPVELYPVLCGEKARQIQEANGLDVSIDHYAWIRFGEHVENAEDYRWTFPANAAAIEAAGIDLATLSGVIEYRRQN